jgi:hypothetical protein
MRPRKGLLYRTMNGAAGTGHIYAAAFKLR